MSDIKNGKTLPRYWTTQITKECKPDDIILSVRAPVGSIARSIHHGCIGRGVCAIRSKKSSDFTFQLLQYMEPVWARYSQGSTFEAVVSKDVKQFPVPSPPLSEKKKIAEILSTWDRAIEQTQQLIGAKQRLKKGLMQQLLTGRMRFPGFGAPVEKAGELPEGWVIIKIGKAAKVYSGGTPSRSNPSFYGGSIPWIKSGELNQQFVFQTEEKISELALENSSAKMVKKDTLLLALYGATAGVPSITKIDAAINQAILAIETKRIVFSKYLYYWLSFFKSTLVRKYTQGGQPNLSGQLVKAFRFNNPSRKEQEKIVSCLSTIDREVVILGKLVKRYKQQKTELMRRLLFGEIRI
jgi:type I restriction enzyme S subunit